MFINVIFLFLVRDFRLDVSFEHKTVESSDLVTHKNSCVVIYLFVVALVVYVFWSRLLIQPK